MLRSMSEIGAGLYQRRSCSGLKDIDRCIDIGASPMIAGYTPERSLAFAVTGIGMPAAPVAAGKSNMQG